MEFKDNVFVVTGGGSGIGRQIVLRLLNYGAKVFTADINENGLKETVKMSGNLKKNLSTVVLDITNRAEVEKLPETVLNKFKKVDGVVNVAGIIQPFVSINDLTYDQIERVININFYGTLYMIKSFLPILLKNKSQSLIANVSSMGGFVPVPNQTIYGASKSAVKLLTEGLYAELKQTKITVCGIYPGAVNTNIVKNSNVKIKTTTGKEYKMLSPEVASEIILNGIKQNKLKILVGSDAKSMDFLSRLFPKKAIDLIEKNMEGIK